MPVGDQLARLTAVGLAGTFLVASFDDVSQYPTVAFDEGFLNDPGRVLAATGCFASDILSANPVGIWQTRVAGIVFGALGIGGAGTPVALWLGYAFRFPDQFEVQVLTQLLNRIGQGGIITGICLGGRAYWENLSTTASVLLVAAVAAMGLCHIRGGTDKGFTFLALMTVASRGTRL